MGLNGPIVGFVIPRRVESDPIAILCLSRLTISGKEDEGQHFTDHVLEPFFLDLNRHVRRLRAAAAAAAAGGENLGVNHTGNGAGGFDPTSAIVPGSGTLTVSITPSLF